MEDYQILKFEPGVTRYDLSEKALYTTVQRPHETNDSYLNRHDISFEELITKEVKLEEIHAYVLIRQSALSPEDRKKIIMDCKGRLVYRCPEKHQALGIKVLPRPAGQWQDIGENQNL